MSEINLLARVRRNASQFRKQLKVARIIGIGSLCFVLLLSLAFFLLKLFSPLPALQKQDADLFTQLSAKKDTIAKLFIVKDRLALISEILAQRADVSHQLDTVVSYMPEDMTISSLSITDASITVGATASNLDAVNTFLNRLVDDAQAKDGTFKTILLHDLSYQGGGYGLDVEGGFR